MGEKEELADRDGLASGADDHVPDGSRPPLFGNMARYSAAALRTLP